MSSHDSGGSTRISQSGRLRGRGARPGARVDEVSCENGHVTARLGRKVVRASVVVGADGANGIVAKSAGLGKDIMRGIALEGNVAWGDLDERRHRGQALFDVGVVPGGYGWVFPTREHANLGVGGWGTVGSRLRDHLARLAASYGLPLTALSDVKGHRLPTRRPGGRVSAGRVLLVGDAAGLVDPLSGDGIYEAFVSGRLAGQSTDDLTRYQTALEHELDSHLRLLGSEAALDRHPHVVLLGRACPMGLRGGCRPRARRPTSPERSSRHRGTAVALDRSSRPLDPAGRASNVEI